MGNKKIQLYKTPKTIQIKNEKGFFYLISLIIIPLVISFLFFNQFVLKKITLTAKSHFICRNQAYLIQKKYKKLLKKIMSFNQLAKKLREKRKQAEKRYKMALTSKLPPVIKAALIYKTTIIMKQKFLFAKQKKVLFEIAQFSRRSKKKLKKIFIKELKPYLSFISIPYYSLHITSKPKTSITPDYKPVAFFTLKQTIKIKWTLKLNNKNIKGYCSSSIKKKEGQWIAVLTKDKYS